MWAIIGTWRMALEGVKLASEILENGGDAGDGVETCIQYIEDFPYFKSVGYGGLPNENMEVELDSAYMDGTTFDFGACGAVKNVKNPISLARKLSTLDANNFLVGSGADAYARKNGFEIVNMLTDRAKIHYKNRIYEENKFKNKKELKPYLGHDTVGICALDSKNKIVAGTSTSGLFMKKAGRIGDSPVIGSGLYADSAVGAASATGLGEDLMKGCISYQIVVNMKNGMNPQDACQDAVKYLDDVLKKAKGKSGDLSVVAIDKYGNFGCATNIEGFSFVYASYNTPAQVYLTYNEAGITKYKLASQEWLDDYMNTRKAPLVKKYE
ncbi:MAG: N(4)-(beta-N-acetylglucosaminyl)-L-asparaginase [Anaerococcus sp.]|nr:N(4)-(beta-N-acetylglucosaminyl)-L-asparaginase [Anaerococcus sp.]MDD7043983.1 N(4)-(beta-N-acetylglucosaminyl)-L-asparaginase [Peptoniphilaceae bacterium]MDY2919635.1 N(4)-(beta-N-acetylglucosaminyl)-L-asparaginase [Anaerococcus sp.]